MRNLSSIDRFLGLSARAPGLIHPSAPIPLPAAQAVLRKGQDLSEEERKLSGALMRVNHVGEVCAQALYEAQSLSARDPVIRQQLREAALEEKQHLEWTQARLDQLGDHTSVLNPLWFAGAFGLGLLAGLMGDKVSLGFIAETERQVEAHLASHLDRLPAADLASREIVERMRQEEIEHGQKALSAGGIRFPAPVQAAMRAAASLMTLTAHRI